MGEVIHLSERRVGQPAPGVRTCWECKNGSWNEGGVYCHVFTEQILNEVKAASDCEAYESTDRDEIP
jgi:hypothetical protein